jgi:hypothetical protein
MRQAPAGVRRAVIDAPTLCVCALPGHIVWPFDLLLTCSVLRSQSVQDVQCVCIFPFLVARAIGVCASACCRPPRITSRHACCVPFICVLPLLRLTVQSPSCACASQHVLAHSSCRYMQCCLHSRNSIWVCLVGRHHRLQCLGECLGLMQLRGRALISSHAAMGMA